jgi:hypothetical protein
MKISLVYSLVALALFSFQAAADSSKAMQKKPAKPTYNEIVKKYDYEQMQEVANYLQAIIERATGTKQKHLKKILKCDPKPKLAEELMSGEVHALVDATREPVLTTYIKDPGAFAAKIKSCADRCLCGAYALLFEEVEAPTNLSEAHKANKAVLETEMKSESTARTLQCAQKMKWFCSSDLRKYLF